MNKLIELITLLSILMLSQLTYAAVRCSQNNNSLNGLVGLDNSSGSVYTEVSSPTNECSCVTVRFSEINTDTNKALSILLSAKLASVKVRVDLLDGNNCDSAYRVYLQ